MTLEDLIGEADAIADRLDALLHDLGALRQQTPSGERAPVRALSNRVQRALAHLDAGLDRVSPP
ncbi:hypothetical protein MARCHEWKA_04570 [Brevundimonas phage vB_BpoS-Marchewka]|uniref:Uncharacterized protein n=1 Tax=Brevundimonas phage vB_BpoS-Marchewka TaxID=2948604 RepID=A0A9E7SRA6_9CAUD|nr:hypothetical protein MARCHEWKA_04570 [Brevundimonas phage vB_BpoS-Marchewka]UTC29413.1 hypothetical protein BAMBUS_03310 [Brevundimonas phage vB_BpoS-Bambus]